MPETETQQSQQPQPRTGGGGRVRGQPGNEGLRASWGKNSLPAPSHGHVGRGALRRIRELRLGPPSESTSKPEGSLHLVQPHPRPPQIQTEAQHTVEGTWGTEGQTQPGMAKPEGSILLRAQCSRPPLPSEGAFGAGPSGEGKCWGQVATLPGCCFLFQLQGSPL